MTAPRRTLATGRALPSRSINLHYLALDLYIVFWYFATWDMWYTDNKRHAVMLSFGLIAILLAPKRSIAGMRIPLVIAPILLWILLSKFWSWNPIYFNSVFTKWIADAPIALVLAAIVPWERLVSRLLLWFYVAMGFTWVYSFLKYDARVMISGGVTTWSWHGSFLHKNIMLVFLMFGLALLLGFEHRPRARRAALISIVALVFLSHSTTGLGTLAVALAVVVWIRLLQAERTSRRAGFMLVTLVVGAATMVVGSLAIPFLAEAAGKDTTFSGRTEIWSACWWAIKQQPLRGYGLGGVFTGVSLDPTKEMIRQIGFEAASAHNGVLDLLLQLGWVGVIAYAIFLVPLAGRGWYLVKARDPLGLTIMVALATHVFVSLSEPVFLLGTFSMIAILHPAALKRVPRTPLLRRAAIEAARSATP